MKLTADLEKQFNAQITLELEASSVYRQLAIEMDVQDLPGMAGWLRHQADEEIVHANKFIDHVVDRDGHAEIGALAAPQITPGASPLQVFQAALEHERKVSAAIRELVMACEKVGDLDSRPLLNWFLSEQIEEESTVDEIIGRLEKIDDNGPGLLRMDAEMAARPTRSTENSGSEA